MNQEQVLPIDMTTSTFRLNPYPILKTLRDQHPITKVEMPGGRFAWIISRYEDVDAALRDHRFTTNPADVYPPEIISAVFPTGDFSLAFLKSMIFQMPPDHTRLRTLVSKSFTPRYIEQLRGRIEKISHELLDTLPEHSEVDFIEAFAYPLPITVISEMLGVPTSDHQHFRDWSNMYAQAVGNVEAYARIEKEMDKFYAYIQDLIADKRRNLGDDLLSQLIAVEEGGEKLTTQELVGMVIILLLAGNETVVTLLSSAYLTFFQYPEQFELLKKDPSLAKSAIEEVLRFKGPLMTANDRFASENFEFNGHEFKKGDPVYFCLASANRDERKFAHAGKFDITRADKSHLAFGKGIHYCLGAPLARLEAEIGLKVLLQRWPDIRLNTDPEALTWRPGMTTFTLTTLPIAY